MKENGLPPEQLVDLSHRYPELPSTIIEKIVRQWRPMEKIFEAPAPYFDENAVRLKNHLDVYDSYCRLVKGHVSQEQYESMRQHNWALFCFLQEVCGWRVQESDIDFPDPDFLF